jgi:sugar lactone lactonase YvrE
MSDWRTVVAEPEQLGESPFWHPGEQRLYWVDIERRQLRRLAPDGGNVERWDMPANPGCIAPAAAGGLVIALRDGIYRARTWGGALELLVRAPYDPATTRFNDGKADPVGRFWAGSMYEPKGEPKAALYSVELSASAPPVLETKAGQATVANGLAWSPDTRTVYWADTSAHAVYAWDWDAQGNAMTNHRVFQRFAPKPAGWKPGQPGYGGRPDGATVDAQGNYWVAMYEGHRVVQLSPAGQLLREIATPVRCPTMPCFGGADLKTLYLTTARHSRSPEELREQPQAGCVFAMRVEVAGRPVDFVRE